MRYNNNNIKASYFFLVTSKSRQSLPITAGMVGHNPLYINPVYQVLIQIMRYNNTRQSSWYYQVNTLQHHCCKVSDIPHSLIIPCVLKMGSLCVNWLTPCTNAFQDATLLNSNNEIQKQQKHKKVLLPSTHFSCQQTPHKYYWQ